MKIHPRNGFLLVQAEEAEAKTASGLFVPTESIERVVRGTVIDPGDGDHDFYPGDKVMWAPHAGVEIRKDVPQLLLKPEDILAEFED